jgi:hypothetical protein
MKVFSSNKLPTYQVIGPRLRVHWDAEQFTKQFDEEMYTGWKQTESVFPLDVTEEGFIQGVASLNGPAEELARGWFNERV